VAAPSLNGKSTRKLVLTVPSSRTYIQAVHWSWGVGAALRLGLRPVGLRRHVSLHANDHRSESNSFKKHFTRVDMVRSQFWHIRSIESRLQQARML
jgi:hypothetical protein